MRVLLFFCLFFSPLESLAVQPSEASSPMSVSQCAAPAVRSAAILVVMGIRRARAHTHTRLHTGARLSGWHFYITASLSQQEGSPVIYLMLTVYELTLLILISAWYVFNSIGLILLLD